MNSEQKPERSVAAEGASSIGAGKPLPELSYKKATKQDEETFIRNMDYLRDEVFKVTQKELVLMVGYGLRRGTYADWVTGKSFPPIFFCRRIAEVFGVSLQQMLTTDLIAEKFGIK